MAKIVGKGGDPTDTMNKLGALYTKKNSGMWVSEGDMAQFKKYCASYEDPGMCNGLISMITIAPVSYCSPECFAAIKEIQGIYDKFMVGKKWMSDHMMGLKGAYGEFDCSVLEGAQDTEENLKNF